MRSMPWRNGGGITHEIAAGPEGASLDGFDWRLSMAEVASDGPFSVFAGVDRTLTLLAGDGISLDFGGGDVSLRPGSDPLAFPGEAPVTGRLHAGPILDLNVMTRRGAARHAVAVLPVGAPLPPDCIAIVCRSGQVRIGAETLAPGDCALLYADPDTTNAPSTILTAGSGEIVAVSLWGMDDSRNSRENRSI
ncbi:HutD family protein [Paracoccus suum]|uniref:HutD family protein n=1 Tax=Paracoccus suum TaxID=2259340 RepID=A0A344PNV8_9RHOB|nr:HutD family protein [Paracoccus suum]AXC51063.1 HutD family protein [Paracoccus suum]